MAGSIVRLCMLMLLACLTACGGGASLEGKTKDRLIEVIKLIKADNRPELARHVIYRGENEARKWKAVSDYTVEEEKANVDRVCKRMAKFVALGEPTFVDFKADKQSEGVWLVWKVRFGEGDKAKTIHMACLEINGRPELGDLDTTTD